MFEWDDNKNDGNFVTHGISFDFIKGNFSSDQNFIEFPDLRKDYGELRIIRLMKIFEKIFYIVYTTREEKIRLISARKADKGEEKYYWHKLGLHQ